MTIRKRVLKYKPAVRLVPEDARELLMRLLEEKPRTNKERERLVVVLASGMRKAKRWTKDNDDVMRELVRMRQEIEDEERGITKKPALSGRVEGVEKRAVRPVPKRRDGFLREDVSNNIRRYKKEREVVNKK